MEYLSERALDNLQHYKYGATDKSLISKYIMKPYWDWAITLFPLTIAPNMITLAGFCFILLNFATVLYFIPDLVGPGPSWIYFSFALGLHLYSTFDNVDGRQARRTRSSSPLGELFDHGIDALNCCFGSVIQGAGLGLGHSWRTLAVAFLTMGAFYPVTWEEYHTGSMNLGPINGPTEGLLMGIAMMIASGIYGPEIFTMNCRVAAVMLGLSVPAWVPDWFTVADTFIVVMTLLLFLFQYPLSLWTVYSHCRNTGKPFLPTLTGLPPSLLFFVVAYFWLSSPDSVILSQGHVILFVIAFGFTFARIVSKMILAYVTRMPFPYFTVQLIPFALGALNANARALFGVEPWLQGEREVMFVWGCLLFNVVAYLYWARMIIAAFCRKLNIRAFSIPRVKST